MTVRKYTRKFQWQDDAKEYFNTTPHPKVWFEILGWITALTTLRLLVDKTKSIHITLLYYVSYLILYNHLYKNLMTLRIQKYLPLKQNSRWRSVITYIVTTIFSSLIYVYVMFIFEDIVKGFKL